VIVTDAGGAGLAASPLQEAVQWGCLARRGMLYSECEAIDYLELAPQAVVTAGGRSGTEEAWYVLDGRVQFDSETNESRLAGRGDLVLLPAGTPSAVRNPSTETSAALLLIAVLPPAVTDRLPRRRPAIDRAGSGPHDGGTA
jgi:mannose-6-phosphate isomerase-like protein (cupin superfamily)